MRYAVTSSSLKHDNPAFTGINFLQKVQFSRDFRVFNVSRVISPFLFAILCSRSISDIVKQSLKFSTSVRFVNVISLNHLTNTLYTGRRMQNPQNCMKMLAITNTSLLRHFQHQRSRRSLSLHLRQHCQRSRPSHPFQLRLNC